MPFSRADPDNHVSVFDLKLDTCKYYTKDSLQSGSLEKKQTNIRLQISLHYFI